MIKIRLDIGSEITGIEPISIIFKMRMYRTKDMMKFGHPVQGLQPRLHSGNVIAFYPETDIYSPHPLLPGIFDQGHVLFKFGQTHTNIG